MDRATVLGLIAVAGLLLLVCVSGVGFGVDVFWQTPSVLLVVGGSLLATLVSSPLKQFRRLGRVIRKAFVEQSDSAEKTIITLVALAEIARRQGLLALEKPIETLDDPFIRRAMRMAVDGMDARTIQTVMEAELQGIDLRHTSGKNMLEAMGRSAPVFGMIGTIVGLIVMLGQMAEPTKIGPGMAVALLTTLYGLVLANVVCIPLARKLAHRSSDELLRKTIALQGVLAIHAGDNPRIVAQKLRAYLPQDEQRRRSEPDARARAVETSPVRRQDAGRKQRTDRDAA